MIKIFRQRELDPASYKFKKKIQFLQSVTMYLKCGIEGYFSDPHENLFASQF